MFTLSVLNALLSSFFVAIYLIALLFILVANALFSGYPRRIDRTKIKIKIENGLNVYIIFSHYQTSMIDIHIFGQVLTL
jgi:hypothetical protein